jgi:MoaA/NifB/PqqE/SkfB family radical SAM enzyme
MPSVTPSIFTQPYRVHWDITKVCNYSCIHCASVEFCPDSIAELSTREIESVIRHLASSRALHISIFGGEPLVRRDIIEIIDFAKREITVDSISITTNGSTLKRFGKDLLCRDVNIAVSFDGITAADNDRIRGEGAFRRTTENLRWVIDTRNAHREVCRGRIGISLTLNSQFGSAATIIPFAEEIGVDYLVIRKHRQTRTRI